MQALSWQVGEVKITQVAELEAGRVIQQTIAEATPANVLAIPWLQPHFCNGEGELKALVQTFVIETPRICVLVDTCNGNSKIRKDIPEWGGLQSNFLSRLEQSGFSAASIDMVLCTHLHFDHVGWNTTLKNGHWVPTFENARYLFHKVEFDYWQTEPSSELTDDRAGFRDSVLPIFEAGLAALTTVDQKPAGEISLISTPGHTPGHVSVLISSGEDTALISGDVLHHPCQIARPDWDATYDPDKERARQSRHKLLELCANTKTLLLGSHFAGPVGGYVRFANGAYDFLS